MQKTNIKNFAPLCPLLAPDLPYVLRCIPTSLAEAVPSFPTGFTEQLPEVRYQGGRNAEMSACLEEITA